jgi:hypothetical protein
MASTTIHTLSYKMVADTQSFTRGLVSSRSEVSAMKKILGDTTPQEKAQQAYARLNKLMDAGKLSVDQYERAWSQVSAELITAERAAKNLAAEQAKMTKGMKTTVVSGGKNNTSMMPFGGDVGQLAKYAAGFYTVNEAIRQFSDEFDRLDKNQDFAEKFGMALDDFERLQFALTAPIGGDLERGTALGVIEAMRNNIALASRDMGKAKVFFQELGYEIDQVAALSTMDAVDQLRTLAADISKLSNEDQGVFITKLFGTSEGKLVQLLGQGESGVNALIQKANELGVTQGDAAESIMKTADEVDKLSMAWQGFKTQMVADIAPALAGSLEMFRNAREGRINRGNFGVNEIGRGIGTAMISTLNTVNPFMSQDTVSQALIQDTIARQVGLAPGIIERTEERQRELQLQQQANQQLQRLNENLERQQTQQRNNLE